MARREKSLGFRFMCLFFAFRDLVNPPKKALRKVKITPMNRVLDFGCGTGSYSIAAAEMVGKTGRVYALDVSPLALQRTKSIASKRKLTNIETIQSNCRTGLENNEIDVVLLYDTFHDLTDPDGVLQEIHRVLKPEGILSFSDHHMKEEQVVSALTKQKLFKLSERKKKLYEFTKI